MSIHECSAARCEAWLQYQEMDPEYRQGVATQCQRIGGCALADLRGRAQGLTRSIPPIPQFDLERILGGEK